MAWMGPWVYSMAPPRAVVGQPTLFGGPADPPGARGRTRARTTERYKAPRRRGGRVNGSTDDDADDDSDSQQQAWLGRAVPSNQWTHKRRNPPKGPLPLAKVRRPQSILGMLISSPPRRLASSRCSAAAAASSEEQRSEQPTERRRAPRPGSDTREGARGKRKISSQTFATRRWVGGLGMLLAVDFEVSLDPRLADSSATAAWSVEDGGRTMPPPIPPGLD